MTTWAIFEAMDVDKDGVISNDELKRYAETNNQGDNFVKRWLNLFDSNGDGDITMDEFKNVMGLNPRQEYVNLVETNRMKAMEFKQEVLRIGENMDTKMRDQILDIARNNLSRYGVDMDIAKGIKEDLDRLCGRAWHVIVSKKDYASYFSFEENKMMQFKMSGYVIQVWKTDSDNQ